VLDIDGFRAGGVAGFVSTSSTIVKNSELIR
jgi:hypothetical protein